MEARSPARTRKPLIDALYDDFVGQGVSNVQGFCSYQRSNKFRYLGGIHFYLDRSLSLAAAVHVCSLLSCDQQVEFRRCWFLLWGYLTRARPETHCRNFQIHPWPLSSMSWLTWRKRQCRCCFRIGDGLPSLDVRT